MYNIGIRSSERVYSIMHCISPYNITYMYTHTVCIRAHRHTQTYGSIFGKRDLLAIDHIMLALFWNYVPNMK